MPTSFPRRAAGVLAALGALRTAACADAPTAPNAAPARPSLEVVSPQVQAAGLTRDVALAADLSYRFEVKTGGGTFLVPGTGLKIDVPSGALPKGVKSLAIAVTARAGDLVAYEFQPHGTVFAKPLQLTQDLKGTSYYKLENHAAVEAAYFAHPSQLDEGTNSAWVDEFLPVSADLSTSKLKFDVHHFSGYMLSSGRSK